MSTETAPSTRAETTEYIWRMSIMASISCRHVKKVYPGNVTAVPDFNLEIADKEFIVFVGPSGCGKSTTLRMIAGLEQPDSGEIIKQGDVGLVFQNFNLFPHFSVLKNITDAPIRVQKRKKEEVYAQARTLLKQMGLADRENAYPFQLSGGQQQRVAIGRALITRPSLILADEPTGNLDSQNSSEVIALLKETSKKYEQTIIMITHNRSIAQTADRVLQVSDGTCL